VQPKSTITLRNQELSSESSSQTLKKHKKRPPAHAATLLTIYHRIECESSVANQNASRFILAFEGGRKEEGKKQNIPYEKTIFNFYIKTQLYFNLAEAQK